MSSTRRAALAAIIATAGLLCIMPTSRAATVTFVEAGEAASAIVLDATAARVARFAAAELQWHIRKITGATLPVVTNAAAVPAGHLAICIGDTPAARAAGLTQEQFGPQEYAIRYHGSDPSDLSDPPDRACLLLVGRDKPDPGEIVHDPDDPARTTGLPDFYDAQGSAHAGFDLLEKHCGVRWFNATDYGTVIPSTNTLTAKVENLRRAPFMDFRGAITDPGGYDRYGALWAANSEGFAAYRAAAHGALRARYPDDGDFQRARATANRLFMLRRRCGGTPVHCNHAFERYYDRFWEKSRNPKLADLFEGRRPELFAKGQEGLPLQLCYTDPATIAQVAEDARLYYDGKKTGGELGAVFNPRLPNPFPLEPMDNSGFCRCEGCRKWMPDDERRLSGQERWGAHSDYWFHFVNRVVEELHKTHPGKPVVTLAYMTHMLPPTRVKVDPSVLIEYCFTQNRNPAARASYRREKEIIEAWAAERDGSPIYLWLYPGFPAGHAHNGGFHCFPGFYARTLDEQFKFFARSNVRGIYFCGFGQDVEAYLSYKLMDDPSLDAGALLDDYFVGLYGPAAKPMKTFYCAVEETYTNPDNYPEGFASGKIEGRTTPEISWKYLGTAERMAKLGALIGEARRRVATEAQKKRLDVFEKAVWTYMVQGRDNYVKRMSAPIPAPTAARVPAAGGDPAKVDWSKAGEMGGPWYDRGSDKPSSRALAGRLAHDGAYLYVELTDPCDAAKLVSTDGVFPFDCWELYVAARRGQPFRQIAVSPAAEVQVRSYGEINWQQGLRVTDHGIRGVADKSAGDRWTTRLAIPLNNVFPGGVPGAALFMNAIRVSSPALDGGGNQAGIATWVSFCTAREIDRLAEVRLESCP